LPDGRRAGLHVGASGYRTLIRQGKGTNMPAFDATSISDADIAADYEALKKGPAASGGMISNGRTRPESWSPEQRQQVLARGLVALRKPDKYGTACANCHSPDAIELAAIAFTDDDILRRALQHVSSEDALDLVDYVHALRGKYGVKNPCSKLWRPFQPGGEPLPGKNVEERELAFAAELEKRALTIQTKPITTLADAKKAAAEIVAVNLRKLPIGVSFPRWSEDAFNGAEHRSFNDWMPGAGRTPKNPTTWYAMHDKYLADPSIQNLAAIHAAVEAQTTMSKADSHGRPIDASYATTYNAQGWLETTLRLKYESVLAGAHFFRLALQGKPGWLERGALPFPELDRDYGPFFHQGLHNAESPCYSNAQCDAEVISRLPAFMKDELDAKMTITRLSMDVLSDPWSYLGQLMDHSLLTAENFRGPTMDGHYWNLFTFEHRLIQQPFFSIHRLLTQETFFTSHRGTDKLGATNRGLPKTVHPLLHGDWTDVQGLDPNERYDMNDARFGASTFLRANVAVTLMLLQRELLQSGAPVAAKKKLLSHLEHTRSPMEDMKMALQNAAWAAKNPRNVLAAGALVTEGLKLNAEVEKLVQAAPAIVDGDNGF
jgi:hypothetical protein